MSEALTQTCVILLAVTSIVQSRSIVLLRRRIEAVEAGQ